MIGGRSFEVLSGMPLHRSDLNAQIVRKVYIALKRLDAGPELCAREQG